MLPFASPLFNSTAFNAGALLAEAVRGGRAGGTNFSDPAAVNRLLTQESQRGDGADGCDDEYEDGGVQRGGGRKLAAPRPLAVLLRDKIHVTHRRGTGPGNHALWRRFNDAPFPLHNGCVMSFDVKFEKGFEWGCRGKIGGLFVGPGEADGGERSKNGASFRVMWSSDGSAYGYVYVPKGSEDLQPPELAHFVIKGHDILKDKYRHAFARPNWHRVELGLKLNSFSRGRPNSDGELVLGVGGEKHHLKGVVWRLYEEIGIDAFTLGLFHGGPCKATRTSHSNVRNIVVYPW